MWTDLRGEVEAMFRELVVYVPVEAGTRFFRPENPADVVARSRAWKRRNATRAKAYDRARYLAQREARKVAARAYYAANRDEIRARRAGK